MKKSTQSNQTNYQGPKTQGETTSLPSSPFFKGQRGRFPFISPFEGSEKRFIEENKVEQLLQWQRVRYEEQQQEEKVIFDRRQKEIAKKIEEIREELLKLAKEIGQEAKNVQQVLIENIPEPAEYHLSFLEKVRRTLIFLRKKISRSRTWLEEWQERAMKRRYYWYYFKKSGAKFWLSGERVVATQTG